MRAEAEGRRKEIPAEIPEALPELVSSGPLSSTARVGIMVVLLGLKKATFSELALFLRLPKSFLSTSLGILNASGLVKIQRQLSRASGPRSLIEITKEGEAAIIRHLRLVESQLHSFIKAVSVLLCWRPTPNQLAWSTR
jgi:DNA-binding transcriptional ArsR family regulator